MEGTRSLRFERAVGRASFYLEAAFFSATRALVFPLSLGESRLARLGRVRPSLNTRKE